MQSEKDNSDIEETSTSLHTPSAPNSHLKPSIASGRTSNVREVSARATVSKEYHFEKVCCVKFILRNKYDA